jgi:adenylate cyclase
MRKTRPCPADAAAPFAVRTLAGVVTTVSLANVFGGIVTWLLLASLNAGTPTHEQVVIYTFAAMYSFGAIVAGTVLGIVMHRRTLRWLLRGQLPTFAEARQALRTPIDLSVIVGGFWFAGALMIGALVSIVGGSSEQAFEFASGIALAGLCTAGMSYMLVARFGRPVTQLALAEHPLRGTTMLSVRTRLLLNWLLGTGIPVFGIILVLSAPPDRSHVRGAGIALAVLAIVIGISANALVGKAIGTPVRDLVDVVRHVGQGELDTEVIVDDAGEIGMLQDGLNEMIKGLRERDRINDMFGRHVGPAVAEQALMHGVTLSGENRDVVAMFVDITGSTALTRRIEPTEFVHRLNRFFGVVVRAVEDNGGLVNKFEGDAALCVFGAPNDLADSASAALRSARRICAEVAAAGEFEIGIGIASGSVVAGQVGAESRLEYTVIGDAVNEASRLTDLAKDEPQRVLVSEPVIAAAQPDEREHWQRIGQVVLRGRGGEPTTTWSLHEPTRVEQAAAQPALATEGPR